MNLGLGTMMQKSSVWKHKDSPPPKKKTNRMLLHYPPEACGKRSAERFREMGGAL
jgi:hypothetical protein